MPRSAIQLSQFAQTLTPLPDILEDVSSVGFEGVEFAFRFPEVDPDRMSRILDRTSLDVAGAHIPPTILEGEDWDRLENYRRIGCKRIVASHFDDRDLTDEGSIVEFARELSGYADTVNEMGFTFYYHNKGRGGAELENGTLALEQLLEELDDDVRFQLDVGHAFEIGLDPLDLFERHRGKIDTIHFRDAVPNMEYSVKLGQGGVDLAAVYEAATEAEIEWLIYEGNPRLDTLEGGLEWVRSGPTVASKRG